MRTTGVRNWNLSVIQAVIERLGLSRENVLQLKKKKMIMMIMMMKRFEKNYYPLRAIQCIGTDCLWA